MISFRLPNLYTLSDSIIFVAWAKNWEGNTVYSVTGTVTSYFNAANQIALLGTVQYILQTVLVPLYSKLSDLWGRTEIFLFSIIFYVVSGIVLACSQSINDLVVCETENIFRAYICLYIPLTVKLLL